MSTIRTTLRAILLSIVACASFVLQPIHVALHVGQHDHTSSAATDRALHWHVESEHSHEDHHREGSTAGELDPAETPAGSGDHTPHPIEDHLKQLADASALRICMHAVLAPAETRSAWRVPPPALPRYAVVQFVSPPTPPELRSLAPRAPPSVA